MKIVLCTILFILFVFALNREYHDQPNCYLEAIPKKEDSNKTLYKKLYNCLIADENTVKWRRSFIGAILFLLLYIIFVQRGIVPTYREIFLIVLIFYIIYYLMWMNYTSNITMKVSNIGKNIILKLKNTKK
jgi:hypothetical protein